MLLDAAKCQIVTAVFCVTALLSNQAFSAEKFSLQITSGEKCQQVESRLKADGKLLVASGDQQSEVPIHIVGQLKFHEQAIRGIALRHYTQAMADIAVDGRTEKNQLSSTRTLVAIDASEGATQIYSPQGPLTRGDVELLTSQFDIFLLRDTLPAEKVAIGDTWLIANNVAAALLGLDTATNSELQAKLLQADGATAEIQLTGTVKGEALGAKSKVIVDGTVMIDRIARRISHISVQLNESREVGHFAPGFQIEAMIDTIVAPAKTPPELSTEKLADILLAPSSGNTAIDFASPSLGLAFIHDRSWRVTMHRRDLLVLRMSGDGNFIAQCNITLLSNTDEPPEAQAMFRAKVEQAITQQQGQLDETSQATTDNGLSIVRIAASGEANGLPITWIHYLLTHQDGRRAAVVFTLASTQLEAFATADHDLIGSMRFLDHEETANNSATTGRALRR